MRGSLTRRAARRAVAVAALALACTDVSTSPTHVASLEFDSLPFPAVVTGDTLRDSLGLAAPLRALAFNASGAVIPDAPIQYITLDTGVTIGAGGILTAQRRDGEVRLVASSGGLQTREQRLSVARRPDSAFATGKTNDTLFYVVPDVQATNVSAGLGVKVMTQDTVGGVAVTRGWLVSYQAFFRGQPLSSVDTMAGSLWNDASRPSDLDTTGTDGVASRKLRVRPLGLPSAADSFVVVATVRYRGAAVRGSPLRYVIHTRPKT